MYGKISDSGMGSYRPRVALALRTPGWGLHTMRGGTYRAGRCQANNYGIRKQKTTQVFPFVVLKPTQGLSFSRSVQQQRKKALFAHSTSPLP